MSIKIVNLDGEYKVCQGENKLTVLIGDGQIGSSIVYLNDGEIDRRDIKNLKFGKGKDIKGKTLSIKTVVTDVNDKTNHTSVTYILKCGDTEVKHHVTAETESEGGSIIYRANFKMK